ncbi:MAG: ATP-binding cassette domain-containing protein, partial [Candidatus Rokuibacteriota bacterium]
ARKRYGDVEALRGIDLTIRGGEVVAMLGPNGAGETTSISLMLGLRELFRRGVDVVDLEVTGADLEEAFLTLTRRAEGGS